MARANPTQSPSRLLQAAAIIVIVYALRTAKEVLVPVALAILLSFLLSPLVSKLERWVKRVVAVFIVMLLGLSIIFGLGYALASELTSLDQQLPRYAVNIEDNLAFLGKQNNGPFSNFSKLMAHIRQEIQPVPATEPATEPATQSATRPAAAAAAHDLPKDQPGANALTPTTPPGVQRVEVVQTTTPFLTVLKDTFGPVLAILAAAFVVTVLVLFMLYNREDMRDRVIRLLGQGQLNMTTQALDDAAHRVSHYLFIQSMINTCYAVLIGLGLYFIGIPNALLWGVIAGMLRFLPYVGPWLGAATPALLAFATSHGYRQLLEVGGLFAVIEAIVSSLIEPNLYSAGTGVSSVAILVSAVFWGWVWGIVGVLLATPMTVCLVVLGKYVPQLEFLSIMLGDEPVFSPPVRFYQRLLAGDGEEAIELAEEYVKEHSLSETYEQMVLPALGMAVEDVRRGRLEPEQQAFVRQTIREMQDELQDEADDQKEKKAIVNAAPSGRSLRVLCLPARDEADELAGQILAQVLRQAGYEAEAISVDALASEMVNAVAEKKADIVVVSALPPSAVRHARYLCKLTHTRMPELPVIVGLWNARGDVDRARIKIGCTDEDRVVIHFNEALERIAQLAHSLVLVKT